LIRDAGRDACEGDAPGATAESGYGEVGRPASAIPGAATMADANNIRASMGDILAEINNGF